MKGKAFDVMAILFLVIVAVLTCYSFFVLGAHYGTKQADTTPTNISPLKAAPQKDCPDLPECVYNDYFAYKLIRFNDVDGKKCYGIRSYRGGRFESMWCE